MTIIESFSNNNINLYRCVQSIRNSTIYRCCIESNLLASWKLQWSGLLLTLHYHNWTGHVWNILSFWCWHMPWQWSLCSNNRPPKLHVYTDQEWWMSLSVCHSYTQAIMATCTRSEFNSSFVIKLWCAVIKMCSNKNAAWLKMGNSTT